MKAAKSDLKIIAVGEDRKIHSINPWESKCVGGMRIVDRKLDDSAILAKYFYAYCDCNN